MEATSKKPKSAKPRKATKRIVTAVQIYDAVDFGYPLAEFQGSGSFHSIHTGDTMDGACWPHIHGHKKYARIYRVTSVRHTIREKTPGVISHLMSVFVEAALG